MFPFLVSPGQSATITIITQFRYKTLLDAKLLHFSSENQHNINYRAVFIRIIINVCKVSKAISYIQYMLTTGLLLFSEKSNEVVNPNRILLREITFWK